MRSGSRVACALVACVALVLGPACSSVVGPASKPPAPPDQILDALLEAEASAVPSTATRPPDEVSEALLPPIRIRRPSPSPEEQRYDVAVNNVPAREFFMSMVDGTPYNMVLHPAVEGEITLTLRNVTVDQILAAVHDVFGYSYHKTPYGYRVMPAGLQTRLFHVDYLNVRRSGVSEIVVTSGEINQQGGDEGGGASSSSSAGSRIITQTESAVWVELEDALRSIVGDDDGRSVVTSPSTGLVVVRAYPDELREVERYLTAAQKSLQRQVLIEAKILEVTLDDGFRAGINWSMLTPGGDRSVVTTLTGGGTSVSPTGPAPSDIAGNSGFLLPHFALFPSTTDVSAFGGVFSMVAQLNDFNAFIELVQTQGTVRVLSSPRVSTTNNQKAVIKVGRDEFFVTEVSSTTVTGTATTTTPEITLTAFFSGIALDVTPQIDDSGGITLHVHPTVSRVEDDTKTITVAGQAQTLPLALSTIRESDSVVRLMSGQIVVIGGLMQDNSTEVRSETPWFGRLPLIGTLFRQQLEGNLKTELVILLRATVVGNDTWRDTLRKTSERVRRLHHPWNAPAAPVNP